MTKQNEKIHLIAKQKLANLILECGKKYGRSGERLKTEKSENKNQDY